jgi:NitT/TauT family transport system permease protein
VPVTPYLRRWLHAALPAFAAIAVWWLAVRLFAVPAFLLPAPPEVAAKLWFLATNVELASHVGVTLAEIALGFVLGSAAGVVVGAVFARAPLIERLGAPVVVILQTVPKISVAPLLVLWLGLGLAPKVALVALVAFLPVMAGTLGGMRAIDPALGDLARLLRLGPWARFRRIELPFALPDLLAGCRIAATQSVTAAVIGELIGARYGLGYLLGVGQENSDAGIVIAAVLLLAALGWLFYQLIAAVERHALAWHESRLGIDVRL